MQNIPLTDVSNEACTCGVLHEEEYPALDVRGIPHAIRHGVVFGALDSLAPGSGLILVAPHDPLPLLAQIDQRTPGRFTVTYLTSGPDAWHLQFVCGEPASVESVSTDIRR
ncbi:DUF2249 domain-containing protein [Microbacterium profundi]|uniref:DUF2249 domain-containing protein n=1 Tax=Microbacterium profundi TaxID=450380 RepID=UPI001F3CB688|nr:DUF2249 domain-containing protein [Microbacterium profundi]MCE7483369.1 DUF2249 domain-containing protein [Microbacterium profundi]